MEPRLYVITRADLAPGLRAAQAGHALTAFALEQPARLRKWDNRYLLMLEAPDYRTLLRASVFARLLNLKVSHWHEPDLDDQLTAIAIAPSRMTTRFCSQFPLMLHQVSLPEGTSLSGGASPAGREPRSGSSMARAPVSTAVDEGSTPSRFTHTDSEEVM